MKDSEASSTDSGVLSNPLSFLRSGGIYWDSADLSNRGLNGFYWSLRSNSSTTSNRLYLFNTGLGPQSVYNRGNGFAVQFE